MTDQNERWHEASVMTEIKVCRSGWRGAWDAIRAAWTGDNRLTVPETVRLTVVVKTDAPERLAFDARQGDRPLWMHAAQVMRFGSPSSRYIQTANTRAEARKLDEEKEAK